MKKLLSLMMVAVMLLTVSCNKPEEKAENLGNKAQITFKVSTEDVLTKAVSYGDGTLAGAAATGELLVQAFILGSDSKYTLMPDAQITISDPNNGEWDVDLQLAKGETYKIAFWAQKKGTGIYNTENLSAVTVDYSKFAINSDDADAFCAAREIKVEGALSETVELKRPLAQLNIGTSDRTIYNNSVTADKKDITAKITLPVGVPSKLNVIGGTAAEGVVPATVTDYTTETNVFTGAAMSGETLGDYDYLTMLYVLADPAKATMDFSAELSNAANKLATLVVSNMPYQANYRTNVVGQLLTGNIHYDVIIVPGFETPDYEKQIAPGFGSVAALNDYFETMADNSDNGDVNPEEVSVSAVADGDIIKLPKIAGGVVIRVNAVCAGTLTVQYADGASDTQKPANVYLYVKKATNLVVNLPASHVELIDDSWVTGTVTATTSGDTFVVGGKAKVGKVEIKQGNTEISGKVEQVVVAEDATADGTNPVEVFLAKESAVKQIELNAQSDVVVEQPKDNIDASTTENKVEVVVKATAAGSSATAQNGGDIYVRAEGNCAVAAVGTAEGDNSNNSTVYVATVAEGKQVDKSEAAGGEVSAAPAAAAQVETKVAQIGEIKYATLAAAVEAVPEGTETTITMIGHETINGNAGVTIPANKVIILDLNGKSISNLVNEDKASQIINNKGTLTIKDSAEGGIITNKAKEGTNAGEWWSTPQYNYATNVINNLGSLTVQSGSIVNTAKGSICYAIDNNSNGVNASTTINGGYLYSYNTVVRMFCNSTTCDNNMTITGGEIYGYTPLWCQLPGSSGQAKKAHVVISGGKLISRSAKGAVSYAFYDYSYGDVYDNVFFEISGGEIDGMFFSYGANITISGGKFNKVGVNSVGIKQAAPSNVSVTGGYFAGDVYTYGDNASQGFISGGYFATTESCDWPDLLADNCYAAASGNSEYPYTISKITDGVLVKYDSSKSAAANGNNLFNTVMAAENGTKFYLTEGVWEVDNNTSRFINKAFTMEGLGNVVILGTSNRYAMVLDDDANNGYVVNLKNLTLKTSNSATGALHPLYVKNWVTANLYNVTLDTDYFASVCVDSSNKVIVNGESGFVDGVDTKLNMYGCSIVNGKKILLNANPTAAYLTTTDCITYAHVTFDAACQGVSAATCEAQFYSTGSNLFVNGEALPQLLPEGYTLNEEGRAVKQ